MEWKDRSEFAEWLGNIIDKELEGKVADVYGESSTYTKREDIFIETNNGDRIKVSIDMKDAESNPK